MIPTLHTIKDVYADASAHEARYAGILDKFQSLYGRKPEFVARAPGRVNIIGDHIDYSYYSVLPMAIEYDFVIAVATTDDHKVSLANLDPRFSGCTFEIPQQGDVEIDAVNMVWSNYFKCGVVVANRYMREKAPGFRPKGMQIVVHGNVPAGGGLSSSAAFVVSATLAVLRSNGYDKVDKKLLVKLSTTCEQLIGVNSGGMDQSASVFGEKDHALFVSFRPELDVKPMQFAQTTPFVLIIANSLLEVHKHDSAPECYNLRVVEVTLAAKLLEKRLGITIPQDGLLSAGTLRGVMECFSGKEASIANLKAMLPQVEKYLDPEGYTSARIASELGISESELEAKYFTEFPVRFSKLKLYQRAKHVYEESLRVLEFVSIMGDNSPDTLQKLGEYMNASHKSSQTLFDNSHETVDEIVEIARSAGSLGSRVTGAGWGGCTVHLVPSNKAEAVKKALREQYYAKRYPNAPEDALIESVAGSGTVLLEF